MAEGYRPVIHHLKAISEIHAGVDKKTPLPSEGEEGPKIPMKPRAEEIPFWGDFFDRIDFCNILIYTLRQKKKENVGA